MNLISSLVGIALVVLPGCVDTSSLQAQPRGLSVLRVAPVTRWNLQMKRDRFSGQIACKLQAGSQRILFRSGAVGFRFPGAWDTQLAVYRIDGGALKEWRNDIPELIQTGVPFDAGGMENPTLGIVWIPYRTVEHAHSVVIRARPGRRPATFRLEGLSAAHDDAVRQGCQIDGRVA